MDLGSGTVAVCASDSIIFASESIVPTPPPPPLSARSASRAHCACRPRPGAPTARRTCPRRMTRGRWTAQASRVSRPTGSAASRATCVQALGTCCTPRWCASTHTLERPGDFASDVTACMTVARSMASTGCWFLTVFTPAVHPCAVDSVHLDMHWAVCDEHRSSCECVLDDARPPKTIQSCKGWNLRQR